MNGHRSLTLFLGGVGLALALGWVVFPRLLYEPEEQPLAFSHRIHAGDTVGMACEDCHEIPEDGRFVGIPPIETCAGCHEEAQGESPQERILIERYVSAGREIPWRLYSEQPENVNFPHSVHVRLAGIACPACHGDHGETDDLPPVRINRLTGYRRGIDASIMPVPYMPAGHGEKMGDCSGCHRDRGVEDSCLDCHK